MNPPALFNDFMKAQLDLAGTWSVALDLENEGIKNAWWSRFFTETMHLPGSTDEAKLGELTDEACEDRLSRTYRFIGPVWYQKKVVIPPEWKDKKIFLFLERTKDSQVWVNDQWMGSEDSLSTSHEYDLSEGLTPGEHTLTILIDNSKLPPVGPCHQVDERTQTNWNGILGRIELRMSERIYIRSLQAFPDLTPANIPNPDDDEPIDLGLKPGQCTVEVTAELVNEARWSGKGGFTFSLEVVGHEDKFSIPSIESGGLLRDPVQKVNARFILPADIPQWDEFSPVMLRLKMECEWMPRTDWVREEKVVTFGLRSFEATRGRFLVNGRPILMRGKNDCAIFPITGYAPMDKKFWLGFLGTGQKYGLNHYRFHSWCPPGPAFDAADELGIYFQVELPNKFGITEADNADYSPPAEAYETLDELKGDTGTPALRTAYLTREGEKILREFGHHPSFMMLTLGNEIGGDEKVMKAMTDHFRALDSRHLYALGTNAFHWDIKHREGNDFWVIKGSREDTHIRGASWDKACHIDFDPPSTTKTYTDSLWGVPVPLLAHEMAQFEVYPDYTEIQKYTGVLKPRNLEVFKARLEKAGMSDQAKDFQRASGALSMVCRKEDIEAQFRTRGMAGFQLLDIQDFSGQGTALIGILDVFMETKGLTTPEEWREFCCETVPLFIMKKYTWTNQEAFRGHIQIAHYGPKDLKNQSVSWSLKHGDATLGEGTFISDIPTGDVTEIDIVHSELNSIDAPSKLQLEITLPGTPYRNHYDLWVYPHQAPAAQPASTKVTRVWSPDVQKALSEGENVLLIPELGSLPRTVEMAFMSGFWSPMFRMKGRICPATGRETPGTQGILLDPSHPMFSSFPTEFHSNWQWWHLVKNCNPMILDDLDQDFLPTVQVIDGIDRNHKLGLILEANVGKGKLIICTIDLPGLSEHPEARQLLSSIQNYMTSDEFSPKKELTVSAVSSFLA